MSDSDKDKLEKPTGQVRHDPGGRAVWQWAIDSGKYAIDSTSRLLKKLDLSHLSLLDYDEKARQDKEAREQAEARELEQEQIPDGQIPTFGGKREVDPLAGSRKGFNPYDSRAPAARNAAPPKPAPPKPRSTQPVAPAKKPGLFAKFFGSDKK